MTDAALQERARALVYAIQLEISSQASMRLVQDAFQAVRALLEAEIARLKQGLDQVRMTDPEATILGLTKRAEKAEAERDNAMSYKANRERMSGDLNRLTKERDELRATTARLTEERDALRMNALHNANLLNDVRDNWHRLSARIVETGAVNMLVQEARAQLATAQATVGALREALQGVVRVADRKTIEFDAARKALTDSLAERADRRA